MTTLPAPSRKPLTLSVKLAVALRELGVTEAAIDWSHEPALGLRAINAAGTDYDPPQHDPTFIRIRKRAEHDHITFKNNGTGRGDLTAIAHVKRVARVEGEHQARMVAKVTGEPVAEARRKFRWPKGRKLRSRTFSKREARP